MPTEISEETIRNLLGELHAARTEARHQAHRLRFMTLALAMVAALAGWSTLHALSKTETQTPAPAPSVPTSPEARNKQRDELLALLPEDKRHELQTFAREAEWLNQYMHTWEPDQAGAVVALMLFRMTSTMETMPAMEQQMRIMSSQMAALPAIVAELNQINAKMNAIAGSMDSTMGRAGRMMPWMPFAP